MITVRTSNVIDHPWLGMEPLQIGTIPTRGPTPDEYLLVSKDGHPLLRIDSFRESEECFLRDEAVEWHHWLVIGTGERVHMINIPTMEHRVHHLASGFESLRLHPAYLLAISCGDIAKIGPDGDVLWTARPDGTGMGLVVKTVADGVITGEAEWEMGEDWRPFEIELESGAAR